MTEPPPKDFQKRDFPDQQCPWYDSDGAYVIADTKRRKIDRLDLDLLA